MKMIRLDSLFDVAYGSNLELNALKESPEGINFVSRTTRNNGVSAKVERVPNIEPLPPGVLTVAAGGSVLETFLQPEPFYSGRDLYYLTPKIDLTDREKLFYCKCIRQNKYKYNYGRQANKTLSELMLPSLDGVPSWVYKDDTPSLSCAEKSLINEKIRLDFSQWSDFMLCELFEIKKGKRLTKARMMPGKTPFIGATDSNNGITTYIGQKPMHEGNVITVNYNGSVGEAFFQKIPFFASDDVNVLYPRADAFPCFNQYIAMFFITVIKANQFKFNYGRKWHTERMAATRLLLPVTKTRSVDINFMENYIKSLPFSSVI